MANSTSSYIIGKVEDGKVHFLSGTSIDITLEVTEGMIGCFANTTVFNSLTSGILRTSPTVRKGDNIYWDCVIGGIDYRFDRNGYCTSDVGNDTHHLYIAYSIINLQKGSSIETRHADPEDEEDEGDKVTIDSLNVRDNFAIGALQALINKFDDPLNCSTAAIRFITDKAYEFANAMMFSSVAARFNDEAGDEEETSEGTIDISPTTLTNNTEKLLNNIYRTLEATKVAEKTINVKTVIPTLKVDNPDNDTFDVSGAGGGGSSESSALTIVEITSGTNALTAEVGNYYIGDSVETLAITLPTPTGTTVAECVFFLTTGSTPNITFASGLNPLYFADTYNIVTSKSYEISALWNGSAWLIASVLLELES